MKIVILSVGVLLQGVALYIAFYSEVLGNIYLATLISVLSLCCLITIRSLIAPACMFAGVLVGLSLSHNEVDLQVLTQLEQKIQTIVRAESKAPQFEWSSVSELDYSAAVDSELVASASPNAVE